jgi:eukaryotic-like serine/threonine-protein kinase
MQPTNAGTGELLPGTNVGGYLVEAKIGEGGMGVVYGARHPAIGKRVAIKVLAPRYCRDEATISRFEQEARLVNEIHHPNIVDIFQLGELEDGRKFLVMEWLEGESLTARIDRGPISARDTCEILDAVCDALQAVHEKGIVHRDLKSDNVFLANVRGQQQVKLLDFGLAKLAGNDPRALTKTRTGIIVGTPGYMAPEQARSMPVDHKLDIYALGVLAHKMLTARLPFVGEPWEQLIAHLNQPPPSPAVLVPATPRQLCQLVMQMMAKEPAQRPTLAEMRTAFAQMRHGTPSSSSRQTYFFFAVATLIIAAVSFVIVTFGS